MMHLTAVKISSIKTNSLSVLFFGNFVLCIFKSGFPIGLNIGVVNKKIPFLLPFLL